MWRTSVLTMKSTVLSTAKSCFIKIKALDAFFKENVVPNTKPLLDYRQKIQYLLEHNYIETAFIEIPSWIFLRISQFIKDQNFNSSPSWRL